MNFISLLLAPPGNTVVLYCWAAIAPRVHAERVRTAQVIVYLILRFAQAKSMMVNFHAGMTPFEKVDFAIREAFAAAHYSPQEK